MRALKYFGLTLLTVFLFIQVLPYGAPESKPAHHVEPQWDSPQTQALVERACYDCHSNRTKWPWYSYIAPISWEIAEHVTEGREKLNFSEFDRPQDEAHEAAEEVEDGEMPMKNYLRLHSEARLSSEERALLIRGLKATFPEEEGDGSGENKDEAGENKDESYGKDKDDDDDDD